MAFNQKLMVRKVPRQNRSRSTIEAIKQATRELAEAEGFTAGATSTTLIAERAGVSVGSLYQYFPTREAIFLALYEDISATMTVTMKKVAARILNRPLEKGVPEVLRYLLALHREHELILSKMVAQVPALKSAIQPLSFENTITTSIRIYVNQFNPGLSPRDLDRRAFLLRVTILGCIHRYLEDAPPGISDLAFLADLSAIVAFYIARDPRPGWSSVTPKQH
jgi:AcrR family transcriptional regulator